MKNGLQYLNELNWAYRVSRVLQIAVQLKIFTYLSDKEHTCDELACLCSAKPELLEKLLIACCAMGLLQKEKQLYRNTELSKEYLVEGKSLYQGNIIAHSASVWDFWNNLSDEILENPNPENPTESHRNFILGMKNITMGERGKFFIDNIDLSGKKKLLDVGGGPGTYSILACQKYPELRATVFDLPETIAITSEILQKEKMTERISVKEGNWDTDNFGEGYDVVLLSNVLHGHNSQAEMKLKKTYNSMVQGGLLLIQEFILYDSKTGPLIPALFNVMVGAYCQDELISMVEKAGFSDVHIIIQNEEIGCSWITAKKV